MARRKVWVVMYKTSDAAEDFDGVQVFEDKGDAEALAEEINHEWVDAYPDTDFAVVEECVIQ